MSTKIITGDCLGALRGMAEASVDSIVTDPPYGLSFMGKRWDYDVPSVEIWSECLRVLKPGGHLLAFAGTRTQHRMAVRIEDAGFEIRDMIAWVYGSGFPKSHNGEWGGTAMKPALEPITVARKPLIGTVAQNFAAHGTGGLNIDGCRVESGDDLARVNTSSATWGSYGSGPNNAALRGVSGRWPANLIHDGSDEVTGLFPGSNTGKGGGAGMGFHGGNKEADATRGYGDSGSAARFFYCAKASKRDRDEGLDEMPKVRRTDGRLTEHHVPNLRTTARANHHPTVKPTDLMRYLCRLVTPPGGLVLDPFCGSGSTGKAAALEGFRFIGIEREAEYVEIARARIAAVSILTTDEVEDVFA
jgi:site-specific DNA-methyltransferase (adenine-specific)